MRRTIPMLLLMLSLSASTAYSQWYLRLGGGYSISASKDVFTLPILVQDSNYVYISDKNIYGTIGSGAHFRLAGGYAFSKNFGLELDVNYLIGARKYAGEKQLVSTHDLSFAYTKQLRLTPSFFIRADKGKIQPFVGAGLVLPVLGKTVVQEQMTSSSTDTYKERDIFGAFSVGFESYIGANIAWPNEHFNLFVELRYTGLRIKSKNSKVVQWDQTDIASGDVSNLLDNARAYQTDVTFVDELTPSSNTVTGTVFSTNFDFDKPMEMKAVMTNFNALGLNIGIKIDLVRRPKES